MQKQFLMIAALLLSFFDAKAEIVQRAFITGVSRGIGLALAKNLLERGIEVVGISRAQKSTMQDLSKYPNFSYVSADLTSQEGFLAVQEFLKNQKLTFDFIINNAGMMMPPCNLEQMSFHDIENVININLLVPIKLSSLLLPYCNKGAKILNVTSRAATSPVAQVGPYCISKAGLNMFTEVLRKELFNKHIAVAAVIPGEVDTQIQDILRNTDGFNLSEKFYDNYINGKLITPAMCAQFLSWLLCETAADEFNSQLWEIYDVSHHAKWLQEELPAFPF